MEKTHAKVRLHEDTLLLIFDIDFSNLFFFLYIGDSGGPLITYDINNSPVLTGVVSWGYGCARPNYPGIHSNLNISLSHSAFSIYSCSLRFASFYRGL